MKLFSLFIIFIGALLMIIFSPAPAGSLRSIANWMSLVVSAIFILGMKGREIMSYFYTK